MGIVVLCGMGRSGTTWASQALEAFGRAKLIHEPMNPDVADGIDGYTNRYLAAGDDDPKLLAHLRYRLWRGGRIKGWLAGRKRYLIKLVNGALAAEFVWAKLNARMIVQLRHPCAIAESWARREWSAGRHIDTVLSQPVLIERFLEPYVEHLRAESDAAYQLGAWWGARSQILTGMADAHGWTVVTHEALCADPGESLARLLPSSWVDQDAGRAFLERHDRPPEAGQSAYETFRRTADVVDAWKQKLPADQQAAVLRGAGAFPVFSRYYGDAGG